MDALSKKISPLPQITLSRLRLRLYCFGGPSLVDQPPYIAAILDGYEFDTSTKQYSATIPPVVVLSSSAIPSTHHHRRPPTLNPIDTSVLPNPSPNLETLTPTS